MVSTEVKRTIVKSPPELWAQVSDAAELTRHLGEFGEIRITRCEQEKIVEWQAELASGKVQMKPSGWGTQVLLSVTRELPETPAQEPDMPAGAEPASTEEPPSILPAPEATRDQTQQEAVASTPEVPIDVAPEPPAPIQEPTSAEETALDAQAPIAAPAASQPPVEPTRRRGLFARLFKRRRDQALAGSADTAASIQAQDPSDQAAEITSQDAPANAGEDCAASATVDQEPLASEQEVLDPDREPPAETDLAAAAKELDMAAELAQAEELLSEQTAVVLRSMLDRLGAAHHRPFSRG